MGSDDRFYNHEDENELSAPEGDSDAPASVIFMEMMRQAAARSRPETDLFPDQDSTPVPLMPGNERNNAASSAAKPPDPEVEVRRSTAMEAQRVKRVQRRKERRRKQTVGMLGGLIRSLIIVILSAGLIATILSWGTSPDALDAQLREELIQANATQVVSLLPTLQPTPNWMVRIGIVSGHRGPENDPGAVCPDGLTENSINYAVAQLVVLELRERGYSVDLLEEYDNRLNGYEAAALVSIHSNTCQDWDGELVTGYLLSHAEARPEGGQDTILRECIAQHYEANSGLMRREGLTRDMTDYHIFREISVNTPAVILELGFMLADRQTLTERPDLLARGIVDGILCYLSPSEPEEPTPTVPLATPTAPVG